MARAPGSQSVKGIGHSADVPCLFGVTHKAFDGVAHDVTRIGIEMVGVTAQRRSDQLLGRQIVDAYQKPLAEGLDRGL